MVTGVVLALVGFVLMLGPNCRFGSGDCRWIFITNAIIFRFIPDAHFNFVEQRRGDTHRAS